MADAEYQNSQDIKGIWETDGKLTDESTNNSGGQAERVSVASAVSARGETGNATAVVPVIVVAEFHNRSAKLGRPLGVPALPITTDFEMRKSSKVDLTHRLAVASAADSARRRMRCSGESVLGAANSSHPGRPTPAAVGPSGGGTTNASDSLD